MTRRSKSRSWMREHVADHYVRQATTSGYRSRAAYKLLEIDDRDLLFRDARTVIDLGASPGSWSQVIARRIRRGGRVVALDLLPMQTIAGVSFLQGDFRDEEVRLRLDQALGGDKADLVVSDMSPNLSGVADYDQARAAQLCELALEFALAHLNRQGALLVKSFMGGGYQNFLQLMRSGFVAVASRKPMASRGRSNETYLLGRGLRQGRVRQGAETDCDEREPD